MNKKIAAFVIFLQATIATFGSLYYSTFGDIVTNIQQGTIFGGGFPLEPCLLCWWARILMYPLMPIAFMALIKRNWSYFEYVRLASGIGILLELYHYILQKFDFSNPFGCTLSNPCEALKVDYFGFITIPFLCLIAFVVIFVLSNIILKQQK